MKKLLSVLCVVALMLGLSSFALADGYPNAPITIICPFGAGGGNDTVARIVANYADKYFGVTMVVDNQPGGNTMPASGVVAKSDRDGYTLLINNNVNITAATHVYDAPFNMEDLIPVATPGNSSNVLCAGPYSPASTFEEFVEYVKANPGEATVSCGGYLNGDGLALFKLQKELDLDFIIVPYASGSEQIAALMGGHVNFSCIGGSNIVSYMKDESSGFKALADVALEKNSPYGIRTLPEMGYENAYVTTSRVFYVPAGTPQEIIDILSADFAELFKDPEVIERFDALAEPCTNAITDSAVLFEAQKEDYITFGQMIEDLGVAGMI